MLSRANDSQGTLVARSHPAYVRRSGSVRVLECERPRSRSLGHRTYHGVTVHVANYLCHGVKARVVWEARYDVVHPTP